LSKVEIYKSTSYLVVNREEALPYLAVSRKVLHVRNVNQLDVVARYRRPHLVTQETTVA
jgi:hypothetical protein